MITVRAKEWFFMLQMKINDTIFANRRNKYFLYLLQTVGKRGQTLVIHLCSRQGEANINKVNFS